MDIIHTLPEKSDSDKLTPCMEMYGVYVTWRYYSVHKVALFCGDRIMTIHHRSSWINAQCRSMLINTNQNSGIDPQWSPLGSITQIWLVLILIGQYIIITTIFFLPRLGTTLIHWYQFEDTFWVFSHPLPPMPAYSQTCLDEFDSIIE